jgi:Predicted membrane protein
MIPELSALFSHPIFLFFICTVAGWIFGLLTGMIPGIHVNNIAAVLASAALILYSFGFSPISLSIIILSCAISHTFHNIIPAIFLGAPGEDTALAVLPGHKLLLAGEGMSAVRLSSLASAGSVLLSPILMIPAGLFLYQFYPILESYMGWILVIIALIVLLSEIKISKIISAAFVFLTSGLLGYLAFGLDGSLNPIILSSSVSVLMPLLSGLFGVPQIIVSMLTDSEIPSVSEIKGTFPKKMFYKGTLLGTVAGASVSWIPGVSSSVAAILSGIFTGKAAEYEPDSYVEFKSGQNKLDQNLNENQNDSPIQNYFAEKEVEIDHAKEFIVIVSAINTANTIFGLLAFFVIGKSRSGAVVSIRDILSQANFQMTGGFFSQNMQELFFLFYGVIMLSGLLSYFSTIYAGKIIPKLFQKMNYKILSFLILLFLLSLTFLMSGSYGFILFSASVFVGFLPVILHVRKSNLMGVIMFPVMLYFLGF